MRHRQRRRGVQVVDARLERRLQRVRVELDRQEAAEDVDVVLRAERDDRVDVRGVDLLRREPLLVAHARGRRLRLGEVVVREHHRLEELAARITPPGDRRRGLPHPAAADDKDLHGSPAPRDVRAWPCSARSTLDGTAAHSWPSPGTVNSRYVELRRRQRAILGQTARPGTKSRTLERGRVLRPRPAGDQSLAKRARKRSAARGRSGRPCENSAVSNSSSESRRRLRMPSSTSS